MALSRTAVLLLLLPAPAAIYLGASLKDVSADSQCLPSPQAVQEQYPGSWAAWTTHAADHKGEKCWFPAARENRSRHVEAALHRAAQKLLHVGGDHVGGDHVGGDHVGPDHVGEDKATSGATDHPAAARLPVVFASQRKDLGWSLLNRTAVVGPSVAPIENESSESSFDDRFSAARDATSVQKPSVIQRMMDPVGAIPDMP
jgi:hypothetical protein